VTGQVEEQRIWRPLVVRGVPIHLLAPLLTAAIGFALLARGGLASVLGAWVLAVGFGVAVGAFVNDARAIAAPGVLWLVWFVVSHAVGAGSGLPRTPLGVALVLAGLGAAAAWLTQRAVLPAVEGGEPGHARGEGIPDIDALLAPPDPAASLSLDPAAEVDGALASLLDEPLDELDGEADAADVAAVDAAGVDGVGNDAEVDAADAQAPAAEAADEDAEPADTEDDADPHPEIETEGSPSEPESAVDDDSTGHVIEFAALSERDLDDQAAAPSARSQSEGRASER
jgi:hypothetical protein